MDIISPLILWDPRFTPQHPYYRLSTFPETTKAQLVKDIVGIDIPEDTQRSGVTLVIDHKRAAILKIAPLEDFMKSATKSQVQNVLEFLEYSSRPDAKVKYIRIPIGPHPIL